MPLHGDQVYLQSYEKTLIKEALEMRLKQLENQPEPEYTDEKVLRNLKRLLTDIFN